MGQERPAFISAVDSEKQDVASPQLTFSPVCPLSTVSWRNIFGDSTTEQGRHPSSDQGSQVQGVLQHSLDSMAALPWAARKETLMYS